MNTFWWWFWTVGVFLYFLFWIQAAMTRNIDRMMAYMAAIIACNAMARTYEEKPCTPTAP
jgi:hypothetical protein